MVRIRRLGPVVAQHPGMVNVWRAGVVTVCWGVLCCSGQVDPGAQHLDATAPGNDSGPVATPDATTDHGVVPESGSSPDSGTTPAPDGAPVPDSAPSPDTLSAFTTDGCFKWPSAVSSTTLHSAVSIHTCVEVQAGTHTIDKPVALKPGHTLRGLGQGTSILRANPSAWTFNCCDAIAQDTLPPNPAQNPFKVAKITLDGAGVATYNVCCRGFTVEHSTLESSRCSAIGIAGTGAVVRHNQMLASAQPTQVPGKGTVTCATGGFGGVAEGAAIYSQGTGSNYGSLIESNTITGSNGPALDINGAWGGTFRKNKVSGNTAWAAVSLYGASNWTVEDNDISHPSNQPPQPYHPYCATGPGGGHSAGIFLCQDTDANNLVSNNNKIVNNRSTSYYGILSVGADEVKPYWAPRNNTFTGNDVFGSLVGCADDFKVGQWLTDKNVWSNNNCGGTANTPPVFF